MNNQFPIRIPMEDPIVHTRENNYRCKGDPTCPCRAGDLWTGALMSIERNSQKLQAIAKQQGEETHVLERWHGEIPMSEETWHVQAPRRRRIRWHRRLWRWFRIG